MTPLNSNLLALMVFCENFFWQKAMRVRLMVQSNNWCFKFRETKRGSYISQTPFPSCNEL
eukprot:c8075_g1_i1 orf=417-596(+)